MYDRLPQNLITLTWWLKVDSVKGSVGKQVSSYDSVMHLELLSFVLPSLPWVENSVRVVRSLAAMALKKAIYVSMGLLVGSCVGYCLDVLVMGSVAGAMCGIWMALMFHLFDLPSRPSTKSRPLVQTPEQGLVKQWTKEEKQTPQLHQARKSSVFCFWRKTGTTSHWSSNIRV